MPTADELLAQSKAMELQTQAQGATPFAGSTYDTPTITAASLTPQKPNNFQSTPELRVVADPILNTPIEVAPQTQPLQQESDIYKMMQDLTGETNALGSRESFIEQQNAQNDILTKQALQNSIKTRYENLVTQGNSIADQIKQQSLLDYSGRGIAKGIVENKGSSATRQAQLDNAIAKQNLAADYAIATGDLSTALERVNQAVKIEYDAKKEALDAKKANIELLLKDPSLTFAQAKRAEELKRQYAQEDAKLAVEAKDKETMQGLILQAQQNGAPDALIQQARKGKDVFDVAGALTGWTAKETAQSIQEYNFAVKGGYKGSYSDYQNEDANRKIAIAKAGVANGEFGLSQGQASLFNNIITKYNASPLIAAADRTVVLKNSIEQARKNPSDGATQLNLVYSYIQALDTYQSAVREGELGLVNSIDSKVGKLENYVSQVQNGQIIRPEVAKQIADAADNLVNTINQGAKSKAKSFESQAETLGLGDPWRKYQSGFQASFTDKTPQQKVEQAVQSSGKTYQQIISGAPKGQIAVVQDGVAGYIPVEEFDPNTQVKM